MLATGGVILTSAGALMISRSLELVKPIEFTHMKIGTGGISSLDSARDLTDLVASYKTINMSSIVRSENTVRIRGSFTNESFSNEVTIKEIGVFAKIGTEQSVLFGYVNDGQGEIIPPGNSGNVISRTRDLYIGVTSEAEAVITIDKSLVYPTIEDLEEGLNQKENKFPKNDGYKRKKSDETNLKDSETLATSMAVAKTMEKAVEAYNSAGGKEPAFNKNTAFNKDFGVAQNQVLEGSKLAEILGIEYGGVLNNANAKVAGKGYYDTANKKIYKCTANTSINYADSAYFEEISNNDLLGKFKNLSYYNYTTFINKSFENDNLLIEGGAFQFYRIGYIVFIEFQGYYTKKTGNKGMLLNLPEIIPTDFRPRTQKNDNVVTSYESLTNELIFNPNGTITFGNGSSRASTSRDWLMFSIAYTIL